MNDLIPRISVIIPAKDSQNSLPACLEAVCHQDGFVFSRDYEVILVDDGSQDQTAQIGRAHGVKVISQANAGPAAARNKGVEYAKGELILFTDADCVPTADWIKEMVTPFQDENVVGVKGAYLCREKNGVARFVQQEFEYKYLALAQLPKIDFIDTYSAAYRKKIFSDNNGFDPRFPVPSVEDQEFSFRLARKGYTLMFANGARVFHSHDLSVMEYIRRKWGIGYWKAFMLRWLPEKTLSDSYTPASQRLQILLLAAFLLSVVIGLFIPAFLWLSAILLGVFYITAIPFLIMVSRNDQKILSLSLLLLIVRAGALGFGLLAGFLFPPRLKIPVRTGLNFLERFLKRLLDIVVAVVGLVIFSPIMLVAVMLIKLDSPGKAIFKQQRIGEGGKQFTMYKLRTMVADAQDKLDGLLKERNIDLTQPAFKIPDDPRVTRVGRFLRKTSLDEVPQFWNILRGEMSLVGPRPEEAWIVERYNDHQRQRLVVKPGLTGPMQVNGRGDLDMESRLEIELDYIQHYSLWLDLKIILQSFGVLFTGKGAY